MAGLIGHPFFHFSQEQHLANTNAQAADAHHEAGHAVAAVVTGAGSLAAAERTSPCPPIAKFSGRARFHADRCRRWPRQNSRLVVFPGIGTGYLPSLSAMIGAAEAIVSLSTSGASSWSWFSIWSNVTTRPVWAAWRPIAVTRLASAPRLTSLYGLSLRIAAIRWSHSSRYGFGSSSRNFQARLSLVML